MCKRFGGKVVNSKKREFGKSLIKIRNNSKIFQGIYKKNKEYQVWMSHGDKVSKLPSSFSIIASIIFFQVHKECILTFNDPIDVFLMSNMS